MSVASSISPDAAQIYAKFVQQASDVDTKIHAIDSLPYERRNLSDVQICRSTLAVLKSQFHPIYTEEYNNALATSGTYETACAALIRDVNKTFNKAMGIPVEALVAALPAHAQASVLPPSSGKDEKPVEQSSQNADQVAAQDVNNDLQGDASRNIAVEHGTWYLDWTSWNYPVPQGVNGVNIFVGTMRAGSDGKPVIDGFGNMSVPYNDEFPAYKKMDALIAACHKQNIAVKISIGGGGGSHDHCWDVLAPDSVQAYAQALADFCFKHGLNGVDFDYEGTASPKSGPEQQALVGALIKAFKKINPKFQTCLCTNAGFGPGFQWQGVVKNILDAACFADPAIPHKTNAVDRLYIMSYDSPLEVEQGWVTGWAHWVKKDYSFLPSQITVGINNTDHHAYDIEKFAAWAGSQGYSTCYWAWNPANTEKSNRSTSEIRAAYRGI
jgi:hypothetical protein